MLRYVKTQQGFKRLLIVGYSLIFVVLGLGLYRAMQHSPVATPKPTMAAQPVKSSPSLASYHFHGVLADTIRELKSAPWKLKGIIVGPNNQSVIIIQSGAKEKLLKAGDKLDADTLIKSIEKGKVILLKDGKMHSLSLFKP